MQRRQYVGYSTTADIQDRIKVPENSRTVMLGLFQKFFLLSTSTTVLLRSGVARGRVWGFKPSPLKNVKKNSRRQNFRKYTKLKFARVKASSNGIININRFANFGL